MIYQKLLLVLPHLLIFFTLQTSAIHEWSFQQRLSIRNGNETYGRTPTALFGRGFITLITGFGQDINPGLYVHTNDEGILNGTHYIWSQQAKIIPSDLRDENNFGQFMVNDNQTMIVSSPLLGNRRGTVFVFNGTNRHWKEVQRISPFDGNEGDRFGEQMALYDDILLVSSRGFRDSSGAAYVFGRDTTTLLWSLQARLQPEDFFPQQFFGERLALYKSTAVVTAKNDEFSGLQSGSAYVFQGSEGSWTQLQKIIEMEFQNLLQQEDLDEVDLSFKQRRLGKSVALNNDNLFLGIENLEPEMENRNQVYIYKKDTSESWTLQQFLFVSNDTELQITEGPNLNFDMIYRDTLIVTTPSENYTASYLFQNDVTGWTQVQRLMAYNGTDTSPGGSPASGKPESYKTSFSNPTMWGTNLIYRAGEGEIQIFNQLREDSCLKIWMSDHFLDGWDTAVLTVRAPDETNDTFHPHCDQIDPFIVRYCPYRPEDNGVYLVEVFAAIEARFFWELSWQVQVESTGEWYKGDFSTKMKFKFDSLTSTFSFESIQNEIFLDSPCYRCMRVATLSWAEQQVAGGSSFWPLVVTGAPYYISDYEGRNLMFFGRVCDGIVSYECYQIIPDGIYILRLGGGLFGRETGFPYLNATWEGCGGSGTVQNQLVFRISSGTCNLLQNEFYTSRCFVPPPVNQNIASGTAAPTMGGTASPTQSVFGNGLGRAGVTDRAFLSANIPIDGESSSESSQPNTEASRTFDYPTIEPNIDSKKMKLPDRRYGKSKKFTNKNDILLP